MNNKKGFSLLLFLVYLTLFAMVMFFSCHIIISLVIPSLKSMRKTQAIGALHLASDIFVRDIRAINKKEVSWKVVQPHEIIWVMQDRAVGWRFARNRLERLEGVYTQGWDKKTTSVVASGLTQAIFNVEKDGEHIIGIELQCTPMVAIQRPILCYAAVRRPKEDYEKER